jgi:hypothetical protein
MTPIKYKIDNEISDETVYRVLVEDAYYRLNYHWPLIKYNQILSHIPTHEAFKISSLLEVKCTPFGINCLMSQENLIEKLYEWYPAISILMKKYQGNLAVCGGIFSALLIHSQGNDVDIFFYDCTEEQATHILENAIVDIIETHKGIDENYSVSILRQYYVTTVILSDLDKVISKYQFIHRIYPRLDLIIGGFDLGACMIGYDGNNIYMTPMGVWSIVNKRIIVDISRTSVSYSYRLNKYYHRDYSIIFPGLRKHFIPNAGDASKINAVNELLKILDLEIDSNAGSDDNYRHMSMSQIHTKQVSITVNSSLLIINDPHLVLRFSPDFSDTEQYKSDYYSMSEDFDINISERNGFALRSGNLEALSVLIEFDTLIGVDKNLILNKYRSTKCDPIENYIPTDIDNLWIRFKLMTRGSIYSVRQLIPIFAHHAEHIYNTIANQPSYHQIQIGRISINRLIETMKLNLKIGAESLSKENWITKCPQRQWTSSFNPTILTARQFYRSHYYIPFIIGVPKEVETVLRLGLIDTNSPLSTLNTDIFRIIMTYLFVNWEYVDPHSKSEKSRLSIKRDRFEAVVKILSKEFD